MNESSNISDYKLRRDWFDFAFENPDKITPNIGILYMYILDRWNRFGKKLKFGLPTDNTMEALGIKSATTYGKAFNMLEELGFITVLQRSKNQNTANIISISAVLNFDTASGTASGTANDIASMSALDKANVQQTSQQVDGNVESTWSIDKQLNNIIIKQLNNKTIETIKENVGLVNENLEDWIKTHKAKHLEKKDDPDWDEIRDFFIEKTGKVKTTKVVEKAKSQFRARIKDGHMMNDIKLVIRRASESQWHIDSNYNSLTLELISRPDKFQTYYTMMDKPREVVKKSTIKPKIKIRE